MKTYPVVKAVINKSIEIADAKCCVTERCEFETIDLNGDGCLTYNPTQVIGTAQIFFTPNPAVLDVIRLHFDRGDLVDLEIWQSEQVHERFKGKISKVAPEPPGQESWFVFHYQNAPPI